MNNASITVVNGIKLTAYAATDISTISLEVSLMRITSMRVSTLRATEIIKIAVDFFAMYNLTISLSNYRYATSYNW